MTPKGAEPRQVFRWSRRGDGVAVLELAVPDSPRNLLVPADAIELLRVAGELADTRGLRGLVLASARPGCFCAGLDPAVLDEIRSTHDGADLARSAQEALDRLEGLGIPVIAAIDGACIGVGLELALVADVRVATDAERTRFGHPAVGFGLVPAAGGTQRLPRAVAPDTALELLCAGRVFSVSEAHGRGLVHHLARPGTEFETAVGLALSAAGRRSGRGRRRSLFGSPLAWAGDRLGRVIPGPERAFRRVRQRWEIEAAQHTPAVASIINAVVVGLEHGPRAGQEVERRAFGSLVVGRDAQHRRALLADEVAIRGSFPPPNRGAPFAPAAAIGIAGAPEAIDVIVASAWTAGFSTHLLDRDAGAFERVRTELDRLLTAAVREGRCTAEERARVLSRLWTSAHGGERTAPVLVIAGGTDPPYDVVSSVADLESMVEVGTVIAITSISDTVGAVAAVAREPSRWVGLRYLPPVGGRRVAEIAAASVTDTEAVRLVAAVVRRQGFLPIPVEDAPGGYGLRLLTAYIGEALHLVEQGVPVVDIEAALVEWGFATGPLALLDDIGWKTGFVIAQGLVRAGGARLAYPAGASALLASGRRGRAARHGFFRYDQRGRRRGPDPSVYSTLGTRMHAVEPRTIVDRCVLRIVVEALIAAQEGLLRTAAAAAVGGVHSVGFPPGRGGPLRYADVVGASDLTRRLEDLARDLGSRFEPPRLLRDLARTGGTLRHPVGGSHAGTVAASSPAGPP
ncbi:MAG: enoyl-CoA hydratase/isomerase family protein [Polyangiaceae bacterium]|nr:enoyl-CoA hydratase/isomerase family protein [Polyangiaceae bacterium]